MERKILIATKTYPSISQKYKETVCTAGLLLDDDETPLQWIRIYPISYRYLEFDKQYPRWSIISADIEKNDKDFRSESFRIINESSLKILRQISSDNWDEKRKLVLSCQFKSIQDIQQQGKSLGIIKPLSIEKYFDEETERNWDEKKQAIQAQLDLFKPNLPLEKIPYKFVYQFTDEDKISHKYSISDWEIMQLYRNCRDNSQLSGLAAEQMALKKVRQKLEDNFMKKKDLYFMVGNLKLYPKTFMIIGLFYPPMVKYNQLSLFDKF